MLTIKNWQISLYCHFNKIIQELGTSFQSPVLSQKHVRIVCLTAYQYLTKFLFQSPQDSKEISIRGISTTSNAYDDVTDFKICEFHKSTKVQISRERNIFYSNKKIQYLNLKGYFIAKNSLVVENTFNMEHIQQWKYKF